MKHSVRITLALAVAVVGCVTIPDTFTANINVTIRHIQEQADEFLDYVEGKTDTVPEFKVDGAEKSSLLERALRALDPVQTAHAQELNDTSPRVRQIADSMRARHAQVQSIKGTGAVGENNRGFLELAKPEAITDPERRNEIQQVIAAENEDRKALYQEIARINRDQNVSVGTVESVYALERIQRARSGELVQLPNSGEFFDKLKGTDLARKLGDAFKPGAWVTVP